MSDFSDLLYDPRHHTHSSCIDEVAGCDVVVLLIGSRFGGAIFPEALARINFEKLLSESTDVEILKTKETLSVTQLEVLKAIEEDIPVFTFVEERVLSDHLIYEKNKKNTDIISKIEFPSIQKGETASYIFEFINFLRHRARNNSLHGFSKMQDIEDTLRRQWSSLFQRLLNENRRRKEESRRIDVLVEQFEDLKTAILSTVGAGNERIVARGVVKYRRLIDFFRSIGITNWDLVTRYTHSWQQLLSSLGVTDIIDANMFQVVFAKQKSSIFPRVRSIVLNKDGTYWECRYPPEFFDELGEDYGEFVHLSSENRITIVEVLDEMRGPGMSLLRRINRPFEELVKDAVATEKAESPTNTSA